MPLLPALLLATLLTGCTAFMPPDDNPIHLDIAWRADYDAAQEDARAARKPLLMVTAAGDITGFC